MLFVLIKRVPNSDIKKEIGVNKIKWDHYDPLGVIAMAPASKSISILLASPRIPLQRKDFT